MKTPKTRHQFYLSDELTQRLEAIAARPGTSKTTIMAEALAAWLDRGAANEFELHFGLRFDRQGAALGRVERKLDTLLETLAASIQHDMMLAAHQPVFDEATRAAGRRRFQLLVDLVAQRMATQSSTLSIALDD